MLSLDKETLLKNFNAGNFDQVARSLLEVLYELQYETNEVPTKEEQKFYEKYTEVFLDLFTREDFLIPEKYWPLFLAKATILSNLVSVTSFKTTDSALLKIANQPNNYVRMATLYSQRNKIDIALDKLFAMHPFYTSCWWISTITMARRTQITEHSFEKLKSFLSVSVIQKYLQLPLKVDGTFTNSNFISAINYIDPSKDAGIKEKYNALIEQSNFFKGLTVDLGKADSGKIAVISRNFHRGHASYKAVAPLFYSLKKNYRLTCVNIVKNEKTVNNADNNLFDEVIFLNEDNVLRIPPPEKMQQLADMNFGTIFYPDFGQEVISAVLANQRLAPIQISCYGNPVSTRCKTIDYFIGSEAVEPENPQNFYSEKLVLIPGNAIMAVVPDCEKPRTPARNGDEIIICLSWGNVKTNYGHLKHLRKILDGTKIKVKFMFVGLDMTNFVNVPFKKEISETLPPENVITKAVKPFEEYLADIAGSDFGIDAYPWGSYNRIMDSIYCGRPVIALEGDLAFNRLAQAFYKQLGLEELIAKDENELVQKSIHMIEDDNYRNELIRKIASFDLKSMVIDGNEKYFCLAVDYLIRNHEKLQKSAEKLIMIPRENSEEKNTSSAG